MKSTIGILLIVASALTLTACVSFTGKNGVFRDRTKAYINAKSVPALKLPQGVQSQPMADHYPIPNEAKGHKQRKPVSIIPPDLAASDQASGK